jgi:hypothetical protein
MDGGKSRPNLNPIYTLNTKVRGGTNRRCKRKRQEPKSLALPSLTFLQRRRISFLPAVPEVPFTDFRRRTSPSAVPATQSSARPACLFDALSVVLRPTFIGLKTSWAPAIRLASSAHSSVEKKVRFRKPVRASANLVICVERLAATCSSVGRRRTERVIGSSNPCSPN